MVSGRADFISFTIIYTSTAMMAGKMSGTRIVVTKNDFF
jgi:hypothetical protein